MKRHLLALAAISLLLSACTDSPEDPVPERPTADVARQRVPVLLEQAIAALQLPTPPLRLESDVGEAPCDDTSSVPDGASLVRVSGGLQIDAPAGDAEQLTARASAALADSQGWSRQLSSFGGSWQVSTPDDYIVDFSPVTADLLSVGVSSPCSRP